MARMIVSYDISSLRPDPHAAVLKNSPSYELFSWIKGSDGVWYQLPNTTLVGDFENRRLAKAAFDQTIAAAAAEIDGPITVEKWFVAEYKSADFSSNQVQKV